MLALLSSVLLDADFLGLEQASHRFDQILLTDALRFGFALPTEGRGRVVWGGRLFAHVAAVARKSYEQRQKDLFRFLFSRQFIETGNSAFGQE